MKICAYLKRNADGRFTKESQKLMEELNSGLKHGREHTGTADAAENTDEKKQACHFRAKKQKQTEKWTKDLPIDDAEIVVCVGRGCGSGEGLRLAGELAEVLGAAIGATRAVTEAHTLPISKQIGQTGKYIRPRIYIGIGVAGAIQHLAGMRNSDIIIAINKDARAPIFEHADYGIVGNLFEVLPRMIEVLK